MTTKLPRKEKIMPPAPPAKPPDPDNNYFLFSFFKYVYDRFALQHQ